MLAAVLQLSLLMGLQLFGKELIHGESMVKGKEDASTDSRSPKSTRKLAGWS